MPKYSRPNDRWKQLRAELNLFGNTEPTVDLLAVTMPIESMQPPNERYNKPWSFPKGMEYNIRWEEIEKLPAINASVSYGSTERIQDDYDACIRLNRSLISKQHLTPFESVQFNLQVKGLSKAAGAQLSRYRHSGHISASRRFRTAEPAFCYPMLDYVDDKTVASVLYHNFETVYQDSYDNYQTLRSQRNCEPVVGCGVPCLDLPALHKEDARLIIPVASVGERVMWINARSLRHVFQERLVLGAEPEIRRLVWMIWDLVEPLCPSFFSDLKAEIEAKDKLFPVAGQPKSLSNVTIGTGQCLGCGKTRSGASIMDQVPCE
jgi:flavin-dependent thymidylate synthase